MRIALTRESLFVRLVLSAEKAAGLWRSVGPAVLVRVALVLAAAGIVALSAATDCGHRAHAMLVASPLGRPFLVAAVIYAGIGLSLNAIRLVLVLRYRPTPPAADAALPRLTVLVPAFNEGGLVADTLRSLAASDYPPEKMQLIAIDDGSSDDTWQHIRRACDELGGRVHALRCRRNRGKRWALHEGFRRARGEVVVTVDSDSLVEPNTLRNLVSPLAADPRVGAVAGNVRVLNRAAGVIPRLLSVSFVYAFDFVRAAESMAGGVLCTPGALSAYRMSAVRPVLEEWLSQTYFGQPATIGEDRAMTNKILAQGYQVKFQSNARIWTKVPTTFRGLRRMFTRWGRSNVRETAVLGGFVFKPVFDWPEWQILLTQLNFVARALSLTVAWPMLAVLLGLAVAHPTVIGLKLLAGVVGGSLWSLGVCLFRGRRADAVFAIAYAMFWLVALWWITPWAMLTSHRGGWLTRGAAAPSPAPATTAPNRKPHAALPLLGLHRLEA